MEQDIPLDPIKNEPRALLENKSPWYKLGIFLLMAFGIVSILSFVAILVMIPTYGINLVSDPTGLSNMDDANVVGAMKILQIFNAIGLFILPAIIIAYLCSKKPWAYLSFKMPKNTGIFLLTIIVMISALPLINIIGLWNSKMHLPDFLSDLEMWMRRSEDEAAKLTNAFLVMNTIGDLLVNLFVVAFLAGLGEELFFRGIIQKYFTEITKNVHVSIFITGVLFSAIHVQFFGFLPRMLLGIYFGYLLHWTGSLWVPILAHFINNGFAVLLSYLVNKDLAPENVENIGATSNDYMLAVGSVIVVASITLVIYKYFRTNPQQA